MIDILIHGYHERSLVHGSSAMGGWATRTGRDGVLKEGAMFNESPVELCIVALCPGAF